jgi:2-keto-4-pentenoate hydratase/2-oxohepta-3-ene-1,7-dioic acid hydratase in catechol pathway
MRLATLRTPNGNRAARPGKIFCVGLNYRTHILEMGRELPGHPTLFAKFPEALIGPAGPVALDPASAAVDWEAELAVVVGAPVRRADEAGADGSVLVTEIDGIGRLSNVAHAITAVPV